MPKNIVKYTIEDRTMQQIDAAFTYHSPGGTQQDRYVKLRDKAKELALLIASLTPISREQSLALTSLQQTTMWANAAIACNEQD